MGTLIYPKLPAMLLLCYLKYSKGLDFRAAYQRNPLKYHQWSHFIQRMIKLPSPKREISPYHTDISLSSYASLVSLFYTHVRTMAACETKVGQKFRKEFSPTFQVCFLFFPQLHINPEDLCNILGEVNPVTLRWHFAPPAATPSPHSPKLTTPAGSFASERSHSARLSSLVIGKELRK